MYFTMKFNSISKTLTVLFFLLLSVGLAQAGGSKEEICHIPPDNQDNFQSININRDDIQEHLNHDDLIGSCADNADVLCDDDDLCTVHSLSHVRGKQYQCETWAKQCSGGYSCDVATGDCVADGPKIVFVTSGTYTGDLVSEAATLGLGNFTGDGLGAGDAICNYHATNASGGALPGTYTAWLSDSSTNAINRVTNATEPYILPDGTKVADNFLQVTNPGVVDGDLVLDHAICIDEAMGDHCSEDYNVWTGTYFTGAKSVAHCLDWTDGTIDNNGHMGTSSNLFHVVGPLGQTTRWTQRSAHGTCDIGRRLYCFQD